MEPPGWTQRFFTDAHRFPVFRRKIQVQTTSAPYHLSHKCSDKNYIATNMPSMKPADDVRGYRLPDP